VSTVTDERDMGLDFGGLDEELNAESYPLTNEELLAGYGDHEIEHANGAVQLRSVLDAQDDQTYESADEVQQSILNMIGEEAVGRKSYSDRATNDTDLEHEEQSF